MPEALRPHSPEREDATWAAIDRFLAAQTLAPDPALEEALRRNAEAGLPAIDVSPLQGKLLYLIATAMQARSILEIGTLGGYSTIWLARAVAPKGRVITLELNPIHAEVARANLRTAGVDQNVDIRVGAASEILPTLVNHPGTPFDLIFLDADKPNNPLYLDWALRLSRVGTLIICDNVVREGAIADPNVTDPATVGTRAYLERLHQEPRLTSTVLQTVGVKGHDGFAMSIVER